MSPGEQIVITIITSVLASGGLWAFIQNIFLRRQENKSALAVGVQCLLRDRIIDLSKKYIELGYCDSGDKTNLEHMYKAYANLGGNDVAHGYYDEVIDLPNHPPVNIDSNKKGK